MTGEAPISVVETPEFLTATRRIMDDEERAVLIDSPATRARAT